MPLTELRVADLLDRIASEEPAPAAGSVAGLVVASSAGLVGMAARRSRSMPAGGEVAARADELRSVAVGLADEDIRAYAAVLGSRGSARAEALAAASDVPMALIDCAAEVVVLADRVARDGNPNLREDAITPALLTQAAARSAARLVRANVAAAGFDADRIHRAETVTQQLDAAIAALTA